MHHRVWICMGLLTLLAACGDDTQSVSADQCLSEVEWIGGDDGSSEMNPGQACIACHRGNDGPNYKFAGTVYADYTQANNCFGVSGYTIEITDANGTVHTAISNGAGNFSGQRTIATPYTALVRGPDGSERPMVAPQTNVDCNSCHGATGTEGAPGRIVIPDAEI